MRKEYLPEYPHAVQRKKRTMKRVFCTHCNETVSRSTYYNHKILYSVDGKEKSQHIVVQSPQPSPPYGGDVEEEHNDGDCDNNEGI